MTDLEFDDLHAFDFEALNIDVPVRTYVPLLDPLGPYLFYPPHCYQSKRKIERHLRFNSPIIAYIKNGNTIEQDLIDQLNEVFALQKDIVAG